MGENKKILIEDIEALTGYGRNTIYSYVYSGRFLKPDGKIKLDFNSSKRNYWLKDKVEQYLINNPDFINKKPKINSNRENAEPKDYIKPLAGEYFVAGDITARGYHCHFAQSMCGYDLIADVGSRSFRVQVKTTNGLSLESKGAKTIKPRKSYIFRIKKNYSSVADILAFVMLDTRSIIYRTAHNHPQKACFSEDEVSLETTDLTFHSCFVRTQKSGF